MNFRNRRKGNTLAEYALPMALVVVASGVIAASVNIETLLPNFFAEAGGGTVSGDRVVAQASGTSLGSGAARGDGSAGIPGGNANAGQTGQSLGLEGLEDPQIEVSGGMGTQVALAQMNNAGSGLNADADDAEYEAGSTYVAMVKDLALTTAGADDATQHSDNMGDAAQSDAILDDYASAVAAKGNAIQQYAFGNVVEVLRNGGIAGLRQVDDEAEESVDEFEAGNDTQADEHADDEQEAIVDNGTTEQEQVEVDQAVTGGTFLWTLELYKNTQYTPIEDTVFADWRAANLDAKYGTHVTIWALDYEGSVDVLQQSWNGFLDGVN